jgi:hypothetical protein
MILFLILPALILFFIIPKETAEELEDDEDW